MAELSGLYHELTKNDLLSALHITSPASWVLGHFVQSMVWNHASFLTILYPAILISLSSTVWSVFVSL